MKDTTEQVTITPDQATVLSEMGFASVQELLNNHTQGAVDEIVKEREASVGQALENASPNVQLQVETELGLNANSVSEALPPQQITP